MPLGSTPPSRRISLRQSGSGFSSGAQDRPRERRALVGCAVEKQRGLDQLELHDSKDALVVRHDVDARVSRFGGGRRERRLRKRNRALGWSLARERHSAMIFLNPEI